MFFSIDKNIIIYKISIKKKSFNKINNILQTKTFPIRIFTKILLE